MNPSAQPPHCGVLPPQAAPAPNPCKSLLAFVHCLVLSLPGAINSTSAFGVEASESPAADDVKGGKYIPWLQGMVQAGAAGSSSIPATSPSPGHCPGAEKAAFKKWCLEVTAAPADFIIMPLLENNCFLWC